MRGVTTRTVWALALAAAGALAACGGGGSNGGHSDTGYGANEPVPASESCTALCERSAECAVELCDEDANTTTYQTLLSTWQSECAVVCTDAAIQSSVPAAAWSCLFTDSCRQVFGENSCHVPNASYKCND